MKFFFDNNLPPQLARGLAALSTKEPQVARVEHLTDRFESAMRDLVWINALAEAGDRWFVVSADKFLKGHGGERAAIDAAQHTVYVLDPQWASKPYWIKVAQFIIWWPHIVAHARRTNAGVFRVPWQRTSQSSFSSM